MNNYLITLFSNMLLRPTFENTVPLQPPPPPLQTVFHVCTYELQFCSCKLESQCTFLPSGMAISTTRARYRHRVLVYIYFGMIPNNVREKKNSLKKGLHEAFLLHEKLWAANFYKSTLGPNNNKKYFSVASYEMSLLLLAIKS